MRVQKITASNFGSYRELEIDFTESNSSTGLTLIQGATGSGKSTFCDLIPWVLFGKTAKGGAVDEIRSWNSSEPTKVTIWLDTVTISRTRGSAKDNDLTFWPVDGVVTRGKDLSDTQKLINNLLGMDYELYLSGAYYHEFSQTAQFFTTTAKNRRQICEQLVDLSLAIKLQDELRVQDKCLSQLKQPLEASKDKLTYSVGVLTRHQVSEENKALDWERDRKLRISQLLKSFSNFETARKTEISNKCNSCGTQLKEPKTIYDTRTNPYIDRIGQVEREVNPHTDGVKDYTAEIEEKNTTIKDLTENLKSLDNDLFNVSQLKDIVDTYRSASIANTIDFVETKTNELLTKFFDAEIRVKFEVESADKLEVSIYKDGNTAYYTQLSKGQRQLLKLCFALAVMEAVQNHHGLELNQLFLDEATDGLDENMKLKALRMLENLSQHRSISLVEHSESLKSMIDNRISVELVNGESQIEKA